MRYLVLLFLTLFYTPVNAENINPWNIIPQKSYINFTATQMGAEIQGVFNKFNGNILFSPENLASNNVNIVINTNSIYTDEKIRDATLKNQDWFDTDNFPTAKFTCTKFKFINGSFNNGDYMCYGNLTILNTTKPIELPFHLDIKDNIANMTAFVTINRLDFNLGKGDWLDTSVIKKEVKIDIKITAQK